MLGELAQKLRTSAPTVPPLYQAGNYYWCNPSSSVTTGAINNPLFVVVPGYLQSPVYITKLGTYVTVAGQSGCKSRFGIYSDQFGLPKTLLYDSGDFTLDGVSPTLPANVEASPNMLLGPGQFWFGFGSYNAGTTRPTTLLYNTAVFSFTPCAGNAAPTNTNSSSNFYINISGALPQAWGTGWTAVATSVPRLYFKAG